MTSRPLNRKCILVPDGGNIALDFTPPAAFNSRCDKNPVVIVLHGALGHATCLSSIARCDPNAPSPPNAGSSKASYVQAALEPLTRPKALGGSGLRAVVFNFRGCGGSRLTSPRLYHPRMTDDLRSIILYLHSVLPVAPLYALGAYVFVYPKVSG